MSFYTYSNSDCNGEKSKHSLTALHCPVGNGGAEALAPPRRLISGTLWMTWLQRFLSLSLHFCIVLSEACKQYPFPHRFCHMLVKIDFSCSVSKQQLFSFLLLLSAFPLLMSVGKGTAQRRYLLNNCCRSQQESGIRSLPLFFSV